MQQKALHTQHVVVGDLATCRRCGSGMLHGLSIAVSQAPEPLLNLPQPVRRVHRQNCLVPECAEAKPPSARRRERETSRNEAGDAASRTDQGHARARVTRVEWQPACGQHRSAGGAASSPARMYTPAARWPMQSRARCDPAAATPRRSAPCSPMTATEAVGGGAYHRPVG